MECITLHTGLTVFCLFCCLFQCVENFQAHSDKLMAFSSDFLLVLKRFGEFLIPPPPPPDQLNQSLSMGLEF